MKKIIFIANLLLCTISFSYAETLEDMVKNVNRARSEARYCGKEYFLAAKPLKINMALQRAAEKHAIDMASKKYFDHKNLEGDTPFVRIEREGYKYSTAGENIAMGYKNSQKAIEGWLTSVGHCSNIMNPEFTEIGMAHSEDYWVQTFGSAQ